MADLPYARDPRSADEAVAGNADARDDVADERDRAADERDTAAADLDMRSSIQTQLKGDDVDSRHRDNRHEAMVDRQHSGRDRQESAEDRHHAAHDREERDA